MGTGAAGPQMAKQGWWWWWRDLSEERDLRIELSLSASGAASELRMRMVTAGLAAIPWQKRWARVQERWALRSTIIYSCIVWGLSRFLKMGILGLLDILYWREKDKRRRLMLEKR